MSSEVARVTERLGEVTQMGLEKKIQKSRTCERLVPDSEIFGGEDLMPVLGFKCCCG